MGDTRLDERLILAELELVARTHAELHGRRTRARRTDWAKRIDDRGTDASGAGLGNRLAVVDTQRIAVDQSRRIGLLAVIP